MKEISSLLAAAAFATGAVALPGVASAAPAETCDGGTLGAGPYNNVTVTESCSVTADVTINGNLTIANDAVFMGYGPTVHVTGNVKVGKGAQLLLGWNAEEGELGPDVVDGNIQANQPLALYVGNVTVHGNVVSNGGGTADRFYNFPIKDNHIDGNLVITGWTGGWWGVIANTVGGNVVLAHNRSVVVPEDESTCEGTFPGGCDAVSGVDEDASEVQSRLIPDVVDNPQHISGNLICSDNTPAAHFNALDGGAANVVDGRKIGECADL
jgi:hypothetical protein